MRPVDGPITTKFSEPRPLSKPPEERTHIHGAVDIASPSGTPIKAPEAGTVFVWCAYRIEPGTYWPATPIVHGHEFPFRNYFYDTFGGVIVLKGRCTHVITHSYANQLFNKGLHTFGGTVEEVDDKRFPIHAVYSRRIEVKRGATIGFVGNAGYSTGPHIHWEIHSAAGWQRWEARVNPEQWE